jgi:predicted nucleic acid-binding protein
MTEDASQPRLYLDTNIFIYAFEGDPSEVRHLLEFFECLQQRTNLAVTSELTLAELLAPSQETNPDRKLLYENLLLRMAFIELLPVSRQVLMDTIELRKEPQSKLLDSIHVATARLAGCRYLVSGDKRMRQLPSGMVRVPPDAGSIRTLLESLRA